MFKYLTTMLLIAATGMMNAQHLTQTIRGSVNDKVSNIPLPGATILVLNTDPVLGNISSGDGTFRINEVPVGKHTLKVTYLGYEDLVVPEILVTSGKEVVLNLLLIEDVEVMQAVEIIGNEDKQDSNNSMTTVSTRTFSVEETQKFAAAINDPGRMAVSYAGVVSPDDGGNKISVRGNSPYGLLWRMEGTDIPNPNHFAIPASSGGGISILSAQTLSNSDFITGAFPAEYGNALAAVFDLRLRKGNNEKREYTLSAGFLGMDAAVEGPFRKGYEGSYLINYRYSTLSMLASLGLDVGSGVTTFQDVSYNFYLPTKKFGTFQLFGFGGLSSSVDEAKRDSAEWEYTWQRYDSEFISNTGAAGLKHVINLSDRTYLQSSAMLSGIKTTYEQEKLESDYQPVRDFEEEFTTSKLTLSTILNQKFNAKHSMRSGIYLNGSEFRVFRTFLDQESQQFETTMDQKGDMETVQAFSQWKYRINKHVTLNNGVHVLYLPMNESISVEPRAAAKYESENHQVFSLGYGLHSQVQPIGVYKAQVLDDEGQYYRPNEGLGFNKAHHFVAGYQRPVNNHIYVKTEVYYQHLFNIAVGSEEGSTLSSLNNAEDFLNDPMNNNGIGRNYGLELTLEQFTYKNAYFLFSASLYDSKYKANDGVWRNTRFNGNYALSFTGGKERPIGKPEKNKTIGFNARFLYTGGLRDTPVDVERSRAEGQTQRFDDLAFTIKNEDYLRLDLRLSIRRNRPHATTTLALDVQNATNHKNIYGKYFDPQSGEVRTSYQLSLIPILSYKVEF